MKRDEAIQLRSICRFVCRWQGWSVVGVLVQGTCIFSMKSGVKSFADDHK